MPNAIQRAVQGGFDTHRENCSQPACPRCAAIDYEIAAEEELIRAEQARRERLESEVL